jgi:hypothetical protein
MVVMPQRGAQAKIVCAAKDHSIRTSPVISTCTLELPLFWLPRHQSFENSNRCRLGNRSPPPFIAFPIPFIAERPRQFSRLGEYGSASKFFTSWLASTPFDVRVSSMTIERRSTEVFNSCASLSGSSSSLSSIRNTFCKFGSLVGLFDTGLFKASNPCRATGFIVRYRTVSCYSDNGRRLSRLKAMSGHPAVAGLAFSVQPHRVTKE